MSIVETAAQIAAIATVIGAAFSYTILRPLNASIKALREAVDGGRPIRALRPSPHRRTRREGARMKITTDMIVGTGLAVALLAAIFCGGSAELQTTLGSGLIGYLGRTAIENRKDDLR